MSSFDLFISHSGKHQSEKELGRQISLTLLLNQKMAWFDEDRLRVGNVLNEALSNGVRQSRSFLLIWSKAASESTFVEDEYKLAIDLESRGLISTVLIIRLDDTCLPEELKKFFWIEWKSETSALHMQEIYSYLYPSSLNNHLSFVAAMEHWHSYSEETHYNLQLKTNYLIRQFCQLKLNLQNYSLTTSSEDLHDSIRKLLKARLFQIYPALPSHFPIPLGDGTYELIFNNRMRKPPKVQFKFVPGDLKLDVIEIDEIRIVFAFRNEKGKTLTSLVPFIYEIEAEAEL